MAPTADTKSDRAPATEQELHHKLLNGCSWVINFDWETLEPGHIFPSEVYGKEGGDGSQKPWPALVSTELRRSQLRNGSSSAQGDYDVSSGYFSPPPSDVHILSKAYFMSNVSKRTEARLYSRRFSPNFYTELYKPDGDTTAHLPEDATTPAEDTTKASLETGGDGEGDCSDITTSRSVPVGDPSLPQSTASGSSRESSVDKDMSTSSESEDDMIWSPEPDDKLFLLIDIVARGLLAEYKTVPLPSILTTTPSGVVSRGIAGAASASDRVLHPSPAHRTAQGTQPVQKPSTKKRSHARQREDEESEGDGSRRKRPRKRQTQKYASKEDKLFACPFWKLDPSEYRKCFSATLKDTSRVKQHIRRHHAPEFYCERCLAVFPNQATHQAHIQTSETCRPQSHVFDGITHHQRYQLSKKSKPDLSDSERWFAIWDIVFPNRPRPASPYLDASLSEDLCQFREFAHARGPELIATEMRARNIEITAPWGHGHAASTLERAISRGFALMFETWLAERAEPQPASNTSSTTRQADSQPPQPPYSGASTDSTTPDAAYHSNQETPATSILSPNDGNSNATAQPDCPGNIPQSEPHISRQSHEYGRQAPDSTMGASWADIAAREDGAGADFDWEHYCFAYDACGETNLEFQDETGGFNEFQF